MDNIKYNKGYLIVEFPDEKSKIKCVELVPDTWVYTENEIFFCQYPPNEELKNVAKWVKNRTEPQPSWSPFLVSIISKAKNYEQGQRHLLRSYTSKDVNSSDTDNCRVVMPIKLSQQNISKELLNVQPLTNHPKEHLNDSFESDSTDDSLTDDHQPKSSSPWTKKTNIESKETQDISSLIEELKIFIKSEITKAKRSIIYDIEKKTNSLQVLVSGLVSMEKPTSDQPWSVINTQLPIETLDEFLEFEIELNDNVEKQKALKEIYEIITVGSDYYERDINNIIGKVIKKSVQIHYSGAGRKMNGEGKRSFKETKTFQCMNDFLLTKYKHSGKKINIITATSHYLSGAKDREGGRNKRKENQENLQ